MEEIINSVMQSPENTNPNVLRSQLQNIGGGSGGGFYSVTMEQIDGKFTLNKTAQEIITACQSQIVFFSFESGGQTVYAPLGSISISSMNTVDITFGFLGFNATTVNNYPVLTG